MTGGQESASASAGKAVLPMWQVGLGMVIGWIGLAGLADNVVEWKEWFEIGWMEHWRVIKLWMIENLLSWLPFRLPTWGIDYFAVGMVVGRPLVSHIGMQEKTGGDAADCVADTVVSIPIALIWPLMVVGFGLGLMLGDKRDDYFARTRRFFTALFVQIVAFMLFLFVASDLLYTLGLAPRPA